MNHLFICKHFAKGNFSFLSRLLQNFFNLEQIGYLNAQLLEQNSPDLSHGRIHHPNFSLCEWCSLSHGELSFPVADLPRIDIVYFLVQRESKKTLPFAKHL